MDLRKTGGLIRSLRCGQHLTQRDLAERLGVSDKTVSKWERGAGCPDVASLNAIAGALGINVSELLAGEAVTATNRSGNLRRIQFYLCPVCGNIVTGTGSAFLSCCGQQLTPLAAQAPEDAAHMPHLETVEDESYITLPHPMEKKHYITFLAGVTSDRLQLAKLYPEQDAAARLPLRGHGELYICCSCHGLYRIKF